MKYKKYIYFVYFSYKSGIGHNQTTSNTPLNSNAKVLLLQKAIEQKYAIKDVIITNYTLFRKTRRR